MGQRTVRQARAEDAPQILALGNRLAEGAAPWRPQAEFARVAHGWLAASVSAMDADHPVWVAEESETIAGAISAGIREHFTGQADCYIGELVVNPAHEGKGIGRKLVETVETWALAQGVPRVTLDTGAANHRARRFYKNLGFLEEQVQLTKFLGEGHNP